MQTQDADPSRFEKRAPFAWPTIALKPSGSVTLRWPDPQPVSVSGGWLRIVVSVDDREEKSLTVRAARNQDFLGAFDLRYAHSLEPFQLRLDPEAYASAVSDGVTLTLSNADSPLWILGQNLPAGAGHLSPHLIPDAPEHAEQAFFDRLGSLASVQPFGWMEGCVLDGLHDLHVATGDLRWLKAFDSHLNLFITPDDQLVYEDPRGCPADNRIYGIEGTLPFAPLAKASPEHPILDLAAQFFRARLQADGSFLHPETITAEGSYTIAYPLSVMAQVRQDPSLARLAANVLRVRRSSLHRPDGLWLRHHLDGSRSFRSWARGVAWYLLGLGRSLEHLEGLTETRDLKVDFREAAAWASALQRSDGLWGCYLDDEEILPDTSGSAGIAASFARGGKAGFLDEAFHFMAQHCWESLVPFLTPDGFLNGAAQSNRGGESLQRGPYRVLSPMGMGLMGQLAAALGRR